MRTVKVILYGLLFASIGVILALIVNIFIGVVQVEGNSMEPTYYSGQYLLLNKQVNKYQINDIIVANIVAVNNGKNTKIIKRIVAVAGDTIEIKAGNLYRNGEKIIEPFIKEAMNPKEVMNKLTVPDGEVFVLGDNRNHSIDSREQGTIKIASIVGKIIN